MMCDMQVDEAAIKLIEEQIVAEIEQLEQENARMNKINDLDEIIGHNKCDEEWLNEMAAAIEVENPNFDVLNYVDLGLGSFPDDAVEEGTMNECELNHPYTNLNQYSIMGQDDFELTYPTQPRMSSDIEKTFVLKIKEQERLIAELQNKVKSLQTTQMNGRQSSTENDSQQVVQLSPIEESTKVQSENEEICITSAGSLSQSDGPNTRVPMEGLQEQLEEIRIISEDIALESKFQSEDSSRIDSSIQSGNLQKKRRRPKRKMEVLHDSRKINSYERNRKMKNDRDTLKRKQKGGKSYTCNECKRQFIRKFALIRHLRTHSGEKPFECNVCQKAFSQSCHLSTHLRTHSGEKPFKCNVCQKAFSNPSSLSSHLRTHTGEKPFKCNVCQKAFSQSCNLSTHLRTHSGEKPFKCKVCQKAFSRSGDLSTHLRTHSGEKPFKCNVCQKAFSQSCNLSSHLRTHYDEGPFKCEHCKASYNYRLGLVNHMKTHTL